jgi:hypothetical protein
VDRDGDDRLGGFGADSLNTGGRYNPITDSWSATSIGLNVPPALYDHQSVWTGHEMIVWGRDGYGGPPTGGRYDPATDTWRGMATSTTTPGYWKIPYLWTGDEMLVWGDGPEPGSRYDPSTDSWRRSRRDPTLRTSGPTT